MKKLPIGRDNFKDIIEGDFYYVDKTEIIEELLKKGAYVTLFPRPRRFGKSLMISTLDEFFNIEKAENNKNLFKGLNIAKSNYRKEQGKYPVIRLNFKSLKADDWDGMYARMKEEIREVYSNKRYVFNNLDDDERKVYTKILRKEANQDEYEKSIKMLSQYMEPMDFDGYIKVKIPNNEVRVVYRDIISSWTARSAKFAQYKLYELKQKILSQDIEKMEEILNQALQSMSFMDEYENFYHGYMLGLFVNFLSGEYIVKSNREVGEGRFDIMMEKYDRSVGIIVEFKLAKENEDLTKKVQEGKEQIKNKDYYKELELNRVKNILTYGISFRGKKCKVA